MVNVHSYFLTTKNINSNYFGEICYSNVQWAYKKNVSQKVNNKFVSFAVICTKARSGIFHFILGSHLLSIWWCTHVDIRSNHIGDLPICFCSPCKAILKIACSRLVLWRCLSMKKNDFYTKWLYKEVCHR